jgi:outer membrane protein OmpA-like peptidoglycan-associated protein
VERKLAETITVENAAPAVGWWAGPWWPLLLGLIGLLLLALLCALHIWCPRMPTEVSQVTQTRTIEVPGGTHYEALNMRLETDTMFDTNKATLKPEGQTAINEKLDALKGFMPVSIMITGHADVRGTPEANLKLSKARADAVAAYITSQIPVRNPGWHPSMQAYGAGEQYPDPKANTPEKCAAMLKADPKAADTDACLAPDRRVEVTLFAERSGTSAAPADVAATPKSN